MSLIDKRDDKDTLAPSPCGRGLGLGGYQTNLYQLRYPYIIKRPNHTPVAMMSLEDFNSWQETLYLLSTPANAERLLRSLAATRNGKLTERELIEE